MTTQKTLLLWDRQSEVAKVLKDKKPLLFFDYDGTLTPIVDKPDLADLSFERKQILKDISKKFPIAIISGRSLIDLKQKVGLANIFYAGNHGIEIETPEGDDFTPSINKEALNALTQCVREISSPLSKIPGIVLEDKKFSFAIHYRLATREGEMKALEIAQSAKNNYPELTLDHGKKVVELKADATWHKGSCVKWIMEKGHFTLDQYLPFYFGDDLTDENAFATIQDMGITVCVMKPTRKTSANSFLRDVDEVYDFISKLWV